ncbi:GNAT family N-acetyltransferase [Hydrogenimonas cancrithermarum]|uniref:GNAT family N-acetyltransferase n=1 Tax=Hydrogenimonas cancrithermarum TaxID=2993563 RepID=UPI0025746F46|nr:GNAT family N-acetyltransferase [Hydrogenimonas cancrithermarum]
MGEIIYQLHDAILANFEVDEYVLTIDLSYSVKKSNILTFIGSEVCRSNQFGLVIANEYIDNYHAMLSLSFLHHKLEFFIDAFNNNEKEKENIPESLMDVLDHLEFDIPGKNLKSRDKYDAQKLISWAKACHIGENTLPYSEKELLNLEILNLSGFQLNFIPKQIRVLKNLKKLYLANNHLSALPLEIFSLQNLEVLWVQENKLAYLSNEINRLANLKELVLYDNNIQKLPVQMNLQSLEFVALHRNRLSQKEINRFLATLPNKIDVSTYEQKTILPFYIEPLSFLTLREAEDLRDRVFTDIDEDEKRLLRVSLSPGESKEILETNDIRTLHYWVARENISAKIIGLTGIYTEVEDDQEDCWLGWFCIDDPYRGKSFGEKLLEFSIELAQDMNKKTLYIYTYDIKKHSRAIKMYKAYGFVEHEVQERKYKRDLYFKKKVKKVKKIKSYNDFFRYDTKTKTHKEKQ